MADHIQLPQFWMKAFKNDKKEGGSCQTYCFNLARKTKYDGNNSIDFKSIGSIRIDSVGVEENHYHKEVEKILNQNWEIRFCKMKTYIAKQIRSGVKTLELSEEDILFLKEFITLSMSRSKLFKQGIEKFVGKFFATNDIAVLSVITEQINLFQDYEIQFLNNTSDYNFILPSYTFYYVPLSRCITRIIVLTPKIAIRFMPKSECPPKYSSAVIDISDNENIKKYNCCALECEMFTNQDFIISKTKKELEILCNGELNEI